jgi:alpha-L-fucosidase
LKDPVKDRLGTGRSAQSGCGIIPVRWRVLFVSVCLVAMAGVGCESFVVLSDDLKAEFLAWEFGLFLHFNVATFNDRDWANGYEDPASFAPDSLDIEQWADAAEAAGMNYAVLTVKHTGGWNLWDSAYTTHDASAFANYEDGRGDIVREFVETFRGRGMKVGLYYLLPGDYDGKFGNAVPAGQPSLHGLPPEARGDYVGFIKDQLTELLTSYGQIDLMWIDQIRSRLTSASEWRQIRNHIRSIQPACFVIGNDSRQSSETDIHSYEYPNYKDDPDRGFPSADNTHPAEVSDRIGPSWFWNTTDRQAPLKSADDIVQMLRRANERRANYLLNVAPDTTGRIPRAAFARLREVGDLRRVRLPRQ